MHGFGRQPFGRTTFGRSDWAYSVLWEELPPNLRADDEAAGGHFRKFVLSLLPSYRWLLGHIRRFSSVRSYEEAKPVLLRYVAENFGVWYDAEQPVDYQRLRLALAARWNLMKGTPSAIVALAKCYGFEAVVYSLFRTSDGHFVTEPVPYGPEQVTPEVSGTGPYDVTARGSYDDWAPGSVAIQVGTTVYQDDGDGGLQGATGSVDYSRGVVTVQGVSETSPVFLSYTSRCGHCACALTNRIMLVAWPTHELLGGTLDAEAAYQRMLRAIEEEGIAVYAVLAGIVASGAATKDLGRTFDVSGDGVAVDSGIRAEPA